MASGENLITFMAWDATPITFSTQIARFKWVESTTSYERHLSIEGDDVEYSQASFHGVMPEHYSGGGVTCTIMFTHTITGGTVTFNLAFRTLTSGETLDAAHTFAYNAVAAGVPSAIGEVGYDDITFTDGADMDNVAAGDAFDMRWWRDPTTGGIGHSHVLAIVIKET